MPNINNIILKEIEGKNIIWFKNSNSYGIFNSLVAEVFIKINTNTSRDKIEKWCLQKFKIPSNQIKEILEEIYTIYKSHTDISRMSAPIEIDYSIPKKFYSEKKYIIHNYVFNLQYETAYHELKIHPTFAHLECSTSKKIDFHYTFFTYKETIIFLKNQYFIGQWEKDKAHIFEGKVSMHILIDIYKKPEKEWMGVFHASAVSKGNDSLLFLGASGNGKSTSLALLIANGYNCIADDFVPIDSQKNIYTYPAAISIKESSLKTLLPYYPRLENSTKYQLKKRQNAVRFLASKSACFSQKFKCKALVFIKYNPAVTIKVNTISKVEAFRQLVPDAWISPSAKNATIFLDWFLDLPCYELTYSDNKLMTDTVSKIFNNEL